MIRIGRGKNYLYLLRKSGTFIYLYRLLKNNYARITILALTKVFVLSKTENHK